MLYAAILGFGTVGSGVAEVLTMNKDAIAKKVGQELNLKYILDMRDFPDSPFVDRIIHDFNVIEQDDSVKIVAECIGGATIAYEFVKRCLLAGKHVATSNKELVATKGYELLQIAKEKNVNFLFEASVGGGIPVLRPLYFDLAGNEISEVAGIVNGTTNYILTKMFTEGAAFEDVLKDAQAKVSLWIERSRRRIEQCDKDKGELAAVAVAPVSATDSTTDLPDATDSATESTPEEPVTQPADPGVPVAQLHKRLELIKPRH